MQLSDITKITYELMRVKEDRLSMSWEDDRSALIRHMKKFESKLRKERASRVKLKQDFDDLYNKVISIDNKRSTTNEIAHQTKNKRKKSTLVEPTVETTIANNNKIVSENLNPVQTENNNCFSNKLPLPQNITEHNTKSVNDNNIAMKNDAVNSTTKLGTMSEIISLNSNKDFDNKHPISALCVPISRKNSSVVKFVDVVRNKEQRASLPGHTCLECNKFYDVMIAQGIISPNSKKQWLQDCSRHKSKYTPPNTPDSFWELSVNTPDEWKKTSED
eukprot:gene7075-9657_t